MPRAVRLPPISVRLSQAERSALDRRAGSMGLSTYIKSVLFDDGACPKSSWGSSGGSTRRRVSADRVLLGQVLGQLGASGLASSLRRLSAEADSGSLHVDDLTIRRLHDACDDVRGMHMLLMSALGKKSTEAASQQYRPRAQFSRAASGGGPS